MLCRSMKYLKNWASKQGVTFNDIKTKVKIRKVKEKETDLYGIICNVATDYNYSYENEKDVKNIFRIGTEHYLNVKIKDNQYIITKEWYTDPFADSLNLENIKSDDIRSYIWNCSSQLYDRNHRYQEHDKIFFNHYCLLIFFFIERLCIFQNFFSKSVICPGKCDRNTERKRFYLRKK